MQDGIGRYRISRPWIFLKPHDRGRMCLSSTNGIVVGVSLSRYVSAHTATEREFGPRSRNCRLGCVEKVQTSWDVSELAYFGAYLAGVWAVLVARRVEIDAPIVI